jgi:hypothetical protein
MSIQRSERVPIVQGNRLMKRMKTNERSCAANQNRSPEGVNVHPDVNISATFGPALIKAASAGDLSAARSTWPLTQPVNETLRRTEPSNKQMHFIRIMAMAEFRRTMRPCRFFASPMSFVKIPIAVTAICAGTGAINCAAADSNPPPKTWKITAAAGIKETFDSNVFLQSETERADHSSFVTSLLPQFGFTWNPNPVFGLSLNYNPEVHFFHSEPSEDFYLHRTALKLSGHYENTAYEITGSMVNIDGSSTSPIWIGPGGAPATGAPVVRDRRDAAIYRQSLRVTQTFGEWFVRPTLTGYQHDFQTEHHTISGYQNFVDRREFTAGADLGRNLPRKTALWAGYRFGRQDQDRLFQFPEYYDSTFHRALVGIESRPTDWLKLNVVLGPEFRHFEESVASGFGPRNKLNFYVDSSASVTFPKSDTFTISFKRFEQPGSSGRGTYQDFTGELSWRHRFDDRWTLGAGGRAYNTEFRRPVKRNDWVLSANALVNCAITPQASAELSYTLEDGLTLNEGMSSREFTRHLIALGFSYSFL